MHDPYQIRRISHDFGDDFTHSQLAPRDALRAPGMSNAIDDVSIDVSIVVATVHPAPKRSAIIEVLVRAISLFLTYARVLLRSSKK